ncbi:folate-binding protein [Brevundimonas sp. 2R-24]|uniref:Folate-binding protein n=1 Tax=Peiella sedimenti TaxID=3061083 RepID=A0ABT8SMZ6_9CAUL|nr:folate-binding protein [Caulobacteraceae bacterium XZ-24]
MSRKIAHLPDRALVRVAGPDREAFLHGLLSQSTLGMAPGELRFGALLQPQGRLLFDLFILAEPEALVLDVAADRREALIQRLSLYRLRSRVEIAPDPRPVFATWGEGAEGVLDPRLPGLGGRIYGDAANNAGPEDYARHRLSLGVPDPGRDADDKTYPIEANFDLLNGIDFQKGCFIGQETTSRMKRRGQVKSRMLPITFEGPPPPFGSEVLSGELRAGQVLNGVDGSAMALLRLDRLEDLCACEQPVRALIPQGMASLLALAAP